MIPNLKQKLSSPSIRTPEKFMKYRKSIGKWPKFNPPKSVILCYDDRILNFLDSNKTEKYKAFCGDFYILKNKDIGVFGNFGLGAPMAAQRVEELIAFGIKNFIIIGEAGSLNNKLKIGDFVLCDKALRDEGTSFHYLKSSKYVHASNILVKNLESVLNKSKISYVKGATWTTDAIYRETLAEVREYSKQNILTVDMETSAVFAVAKFRKVEAVTLFTISDYLINKKWNPKFHLTEEYLIKLFHIAEEALDK